MSDPQAPAFPRPWPQVPACYGWLSLDRRGQWRLQDEVVAHRGLIDYLNHGYGKDDQGRWLVRNGPQRVYVRLDAAPWILRLQPGGRFTNQRGDETRLDGAFYLDADSRLFVDTALGPAMVDDRDLAPFLAEVRNGAGSLACDEEVLELIAGGSVTELSWHGRPLRRLEDAGGAGARFGFIADPRPEEE